MPMYSFEWLKYPLAFHTDLVNFADEVLAWRMVCVAAYQMNNIPPLRDGPGLWVACAGRETMRRLTRKCCSRTWTI